MRTQLRVTALWLAVDAALRVATVEQVIGALRVLPGRADDIEPQRLRGMVERVGRRLRPRAGCLRNALVYWSMLRRRGYVVQVVLGVQAQTGFEAHAWVCQDGEVVLGGPTDRFRELWRVQ